MPLVEAALNRHDKVRLYCQTGYDFLGVEPNACLYVSPDDRTKLERLVADGKSSQKLAATARIVLLSGAALARVPSNARRGSPSPPFGAGKMPICRVASCGCSRTRPRAGKKRIDDAIRLQIVTKTVQEKPRNATHWTARMMAEEMGVGHTTVHNAFGRSMASSRI